MHIHSEMATIVKHINIVTAPFPVSRTPNFF